MARRWAWACVITSYSIHYTKLYDDRSLTREREGEQNLKLGRGGIREIEFFIQTLQLIYAGKNQKLRERNSLKALDLLFV